MKYGLWTRHNGKSWEYMLQFDSVREALDWLVQTYQPEADFWSGIEVKVLVDKD